MLTDDMVRFVFVYDARFADALIVIQDKIDKILASMVLFKRY